jgi:hypothetical protein
MVKDNNKSPLDLHVHNIKTIEKGTLKGVVDIGLELIAAEAATSRFSNVFRSGDRLPRMNTRISSALFAKPATRFDGA